MEKTWLILLLLLIIIPMIVLYFINKGKQKEAKEDIIEPDFIHIFPDYPRNNPYIAKPGEMIEFTVRGYRDNNLKEVELIKSDITWKFQNYVGEIIKREAGSITYRLPIEKEKIGKTSYVAVYYHGLQDTSWLKIAVN